MSYRERNTCRACGSKKLESILDLNDQPLANSYHEPGVILEEYPLKLNLCINCFHSQLSVVVDPDKMFEHYLYVSGTTETLRKYFNEFYHLVLINVESVGDKRVLDIACNDGSQLEVFRDKGWDTYGIDPAKNLFELSKNKGFTNVICDYFNENSARCLNEKMDVIIAQNVFAHTDDIHDFLRCCLLLSHEETKIFIQTSQAEMFVNNEFDTIYHEHLSFFCANSMNECVKMCGLNLEKVLKTDIHGTSYVFMISTKPKASGNVEKVLQNEKLEGKKSIDFYMKFARNAKQIVRDLRECVKNYKNQGYTIVGYGAAAKGMTILNFGKIELDFIVDDNPLKQDLMTPGMNIPIMSPRYLRVDDKLCIIPLAWNFFDEILQRVIKERQNPRDLIVKYFPKLEVNGLNGH